MMLVLKDALRPSSTVRLGRNEGGKFPGPQFAVGSVEKYQRCHKYFPQYSTFTSERLQVRTQGPQTSCSGRHLSSLRPWYGMFEKKTNVLFKKVEY